MKYLTGQARKDFFKWYYENPKYADYRFEVCGGGCYFDELPDTMTRCVVLEWFNEIGLCKDIGKYAARKVETCNDAYNLRRK